MQKSRFLLAACLLLFTCVARADLITGKILDPDGKPAPNAQLWVQRSGYKGEEAYLPLPVDGAGKFQIELKAADFSSDYFGRALAYKFGFAPASGVLHSGQNILRLERAAALAGRVLDANAQPVENARVALATVVLATDGEERNYVFFKGTPLEEKYAAQSDTKGNWKIEGVNVSRQAHVEVLSPRFARAQKQVEAGGENIITLRAGARLSGRVVYEDGRPAAGAQVSAQPQDRFNNSATWGTAKTDADGKYEIASLGEGSYHVVVDAPDENHIGAVSESVVAKTEEMKTVPNLVVTAGALIEGVASDEKGAPIANVEISATGPRQDAANGVRSFATSDAMGAYRLRVAPGNNSLYVARKPAEFLYPKTGSPYQMLSVSIEAGQTKNVPFVLERGLTATGTARDGNGAPISKARLSLTRISGKDRDYEREGASAVADENGKWNAVGMAPGKWKIAASGEWELAAPIEIEMPSAQAIDVRLRRVEYSTLRGHVVTPNGAPVAGAKIKFFVAVPEGRYSSTQYPREATSDAEGRFALERLKSNHTVSFVSAQKTGFRFSKGGAVSGTGEDRAITEIVLSPLSGKLAGRVLDAQNQPVANARIVSPDADPPARAVTGADGKFQLENLAQGVIAIIALHPEKGALSTTRLSDGADVELKLSPLAPAAGNDVEANAARAEKILLEVQQNSNGTNYWGRGQIWNYLLGRDFDRAIELSQNADGTLPEIFIARTIDFLARRDPAKAATWGAAHLDEIKNEMYRNYAAGRLGVAVADVNRDVAVEMFERILKTDEGKDWQAQMRRIYLAQLAAKLGRPEAASYADKALELGRARGQDAGEDRGEEAVVAEAMAEADIVQTKRVLSLIEESKRGQALNQVIAVLARRGGKENIAAALEFLNQLEKTPGENGSSQFSQSAASLIPAVGKIDPAGALALARRVTEGYFKPAALAAAARFQDDAMMRALLREAGDAALNHQASVEQLSKIAVQAFPKFPDLARELTTQAQRVHQKLGEDSDRPYGGDSQSLAVALAQFELLAAREMLELEWVRLSREVQAAREGDNSVWELSRVAQAMASVDFERALEMARAIPNDSKNGDDYSRFEAQRRLARWLLQSPEKRSTPDGSRWRSEEDED